MKSDILLIEDQSMVRHGIVALINTLEHYAVTAAVASVSEAVDILQSPHHFVLVLSDFHLRGDTALSLLKRKKELMLPPVIVLTSICNAVEIQSCIAHGIRGCLFKESDSIELEKAFENVLSGAVYFAPGLFFAASAATVTSVFSSSETPLLTPAEREILQWLATGMSNKEIARLVGKSAETVKIQVSQLLRKLDCKTRTQAVVSASQRGLFQ